MDTTRSEWLIPGAIIVAGALLALTIFFVRSENIFVPKEGPSAMRPVSPDEHIIGNPDAPVVIVEYADIDSSFAKEYQRTLGLLVTDYGSTGKVAWVYRHFPLVNQSPNSVRHAEAAECVTSLGNASAFWKFIDLMQAAAPDDEQFDPANYGSLVSQLGISVDEFNACVAAGTYADKVAADFEDGLAAGAIASPHSVILIAGEEPITIRGSVPYETLRQIVENAGS